MRKPKYNADELQTDLWMLEVHNEHDGDWTWQSFKLKKKMGKAGGLPLIEAIAASPALFERHGNNLRWRRIKGEDRIRVWDLAQLGKELERLRRAAAKPEGSSAPASLAR